MWELDYKESWALKNWCFWTVVLEKTLESPLDYKEIQPVNPEGDQSWIFIGSTDANAEVPIVWPPEAKCQLIRKDPDAGKDWMQGKGMTEDEMVGWHHWLNGHEFEWAPGNGEEQGSQVCCSPCRSKESDTTEWLNNNKTLGSLQAGPCLFCDYYCIHLLYCLEHKHLFTVCVCSVTHSVMSNSLEPHELYLARLLCPWNFPGKNTRSTPGDLLDPGIESASLVSAVLAGGFFTTVPPKKPPVIESDYSNKKRHSSIHCVHAYDWERKCSILECFMYHQVPG